MPVLMYASSISWFAEDCLAIDHRFERLAGASSHYVSRVNECYSDLAIATLASSS